MRSVMKTLFTAAVALLWSGFGADLLAADTVEPGKAIKITVPGHPEFTQTTVVGSDGTVDYPLLAGAPLDGLTASQVRDLLLPLLLRYDREPEVFVVISDVQVIRVQVYGAVREPGKYSAESPLNLQQALGMAGGWGVDADLATVRILRAEKGERRELRIDLTSQFFSDALELTPDLRDGDVVVVPQLTPHTSIRVFGAVGHAGEVYIGTDDTIYDVIMRAGGFYANADQRRVLVLSGKAGNYQRRTINVLKFVKSGRVAEMPAPIAGDIIYVPTSENWRNLNWWINLVRDLAITTSSLIVLTRLL